MAIEIEVAKNAGACFGVKRALDMAREAAKTGNVAHTFGPLIHNPRVVEELEKSGVGVANSLDEVDGGTLVLRSHGTAPELVEEAHARGFHVIDATCPFVAKVQRKAYQLAQEDYAVVIIGEPGHAEVESIRAWGGDAVVAVCDTPDKLPASLPSKLGVVVQTTQSADHVEAVLVALKEHADEVRLEQTVCIATQERQSACAELARRVDLMLIIGGRNSGNTRRLFEICEPLCKVTHHIESAEEIDPAWLAGVSRVGISAGASTPAEHIDSVRERLEMLSSQIQD